MKRISKGAGKSRQSRQGELFAPRRAGGTQQRVVVRPTSAGFVADEPAMTSKTTMTNKRRSSKVPHVTRPEIRGAAHVVVRIRRGLPWLRTPKTYRVLERAFRNGKKRDGFRLIEFSVQQDHLHLVVEAESRQSLSRGMQGLMIRIAKALNRFWRRRIGRVFADRYFSLALLGWKQAWRTVRYVLHNGRKHGVWPSTDLPDPFSSGRWFVQWLSRDFPRPLRTSPVERPSHLPLTMLPVIALDFAPSRRETPWTTLDSNRLLSQPTR